MSTRLPIRAPGAAGRGRSNDLDGVMEVMTNAFDPGFGEGWSRSQCAGILPLSGVVLTIARDGSGRVRGFSLQRTVAGESELLLLAVHRAAQRCGIGGRLLDHFVDSGRAERAPASSTLKSATATRRSPCIEHSVFPPAGRRTNYYRGSDGRLFDAVTMVLDLNRD